MTNKFTVYPIGNPLHACNVFIKGAKAKEEKERREGERERRRKRLKFKTVQ